MRFTEVADLCGRRLDACGYLFWPKALTVPARGRYCRDTAQGEIMRKYPWRLMLAGFLCSCGGVTKEPVPETATQPEAAASCPQEGDACEIEDPYGKAMDTCLPDQTGLHCCLVGPGYYGFCRSSDICL